MAIPLPQAPGSALLQGAEFGNNALHRMLQAKLQRDTLSQAHSHHLDDLAIRQAQEARAERFFPFQTGLMSAQTQGLLGTENRASQQFPLNQASTYVDLSRKIQETNFDRALYGMPPLNNAEIAQYLQGGGSNLPTQQDMIGTNQWEGYQSGTSYPPVDMTTAQSAQTQNVNLTNTALDNLRKFAATKEGRALLEKRGYKVPEKTKSEQADLDVQTAGRKKKVEIAETELNKIIQDEARIQKTLELVDKAKKLMAKNPEEAKKWFGPVPFPQRWMSNETAQRWRASGIKNPDFGEIVSTLGSILGGTAAEFGNPRLAGPYKVAQESKASIWDEYPVALGKLESTQKMLEQSLLIADELKSQYQRDIQSGGHGFVTLYSEDGREFSIPANQVEEALADEEINLFLHRPE